MTEPARASLWTRCTENYWASGAVAIGSMIGVQWPALGGFFFQDDWQFFLTITQDGATAFALGTFNNHVAPVTKFVIYLLFETFGVAPVPFYAFGLALHALIVLLVLRLFRLVTGHGLLALIGATWWAWLPLHQHTLRATSSIGVQMSAIFILLLLTSAIRFSVAGPRGPRGSPVAGWCVLVALAAASGGMGLIFAVAFPLLLWLLPREHLPLLTRVALVPLSIVLLLVYSTLQKKGGPEMLSPDLGAFALGMSTTTLYGAAATVFGPFVTLRDGEFVFPAMSLLPPAVVAVAVAVAGVLVLGGGAYLARRLSKVERSIAITALAMAGPIYAAIALGRSDLMSRLPLLLQFSIFSIGHYQYLGTVAFTLVALLLVRAAGVTTARPLRRWAAVVAVPLAVSCFIASSRSGFPLNEVDRAGFTEAAARLEKTIHAYEPGLVYVQNQPFSPMAMVYGIVGAADRGRIEYPGLAVVFAFVYRSDTAEGRTLRFVDDDDVVGYWRARGGLLSRLLVTRAEAAGRTR